MLDGHDRGSSFADFGLSRKREEDSGSERYDRRDGWCICILVVTEWAIVQNAVHLAELIDCCTLDIDFGPVNSFSQLRSIVVHILQFVLDLCVSEDKLTRRPK